MSNFINKDISKMDDYQGELHKQEKMHFILKELGFAKTDLTDNEIAVLSDMGGFCGEFEFPEFLSEFLDYSVEMTRELSDIKKLLNWNDHQVAGLISSLESKGLAYSFNVDEYTFINPSHRGLHIMIKQFANIDVAPSDCEWCSINI